MIITTERLVITSMPIDANGDSPWTSEEIITAIFKFHSDPRTYTHRPDLVMKTEDEAREVFQIWRGCWANDGIGYCTVTLRNGPIIGFCGLKYATQDGRRVLNMFYRFDPEFWGHGYAIEAAQATITATKNHINVDSLPIIALIDLTNQASISLAERLGFVLDAAWETEAGSGVWVLQK